MKLCKRILHSFFIATCLVAPMHIRAYAEIAGNALIPNIATQESNQKDIDDYSYDDDTSNQEIHDPYEKINRKIYRFNRGIDKVLYRPATHVYRAVLPKKARDRIHFALQNLSEPITFVNGCLQGNPKVAAHSFWRFVMNSTLGIGGMFDFAEMHAKLPSHSEDFGQTLGHWGAESGPYIVLPFFGPSTVRDTVGKIGDILADPFTYAHGTVRYIKNGVNIVDIRDDSWNLLDSIEYTSLDSYATLRSLYMQHRNYVIKDTTTFTDSPHPYTPSPS